MLALLARIALSAVLVSSLAACIEIKEPVLPASDLAYPEGLEGEWILLDAAKKEKPQVAIIERRDDGYFVINTYPVEDDDKSKPGNYPTRLIQSELEGGFIVVASIMDLHFLGAVVRLDEGQDDNARWVFAAFAVKEGTAPETLAAWLQEKHGLVSKGGGFPFSIEGAVNAEKLRRLVDDDGLSDLAQLGAIARLAPLPEDHPYRSRMESSPSPAAALDVAIEVVYSAATKAYQQADYATALEKFSTLAERGHAASEYALGQMHENGHGTAADDAEAAKWYRRAAEQGFPDAQTALGILLLNGRGMPEDHAGGIAWLEQAAAQGHERAIALLFLEKEQARLDTEMAAMTEEIRQAEERMKEICGGRLCQTLEDGRRIYRTVTYDPPKWYFEDGALAPESLWPNR
jgi:hypothetical protein